MAIDAVLLCPVDLCPWKNYLCERASEEWLRIEGHIMNITLWVLQALLAIAFLAHGLLFLFPPPELLPQMNALIPRAFGIFLGVAEVAAAVGMTVPGLTRVQPWLIPWAAAGLMPVMVGATILHIARNEVSSAVITAVLLVLLTFVAYMRWKVMPIQPRRVADVKGASGRAATS
jgi:uncharacterized membrane protein YphA (DoxX/SURF4 family)